MLIKVSQELEFTTRQSAEKHQKGIYMVYRRILVEDVTCRKGIGGNAKAMSLKADLLSLSQ
jgi:hypothetical protein